MKKCSVCCVIRPSYPRTHSSRRHLVWVVCHNCSHAFLRNSWICQIIVLLFFSSHLYYSQILMSILANFSNLSSGMGLGFPAITFQSLTNSSDPMALTNEEASWFGKFGSFDFATILCVVDAEHFHVSTNNYDKQTRLQWFFCSSMCSLHILWTTCTIELTIFISFVPRWKWHLQWKRRKQWFDF